MTCTTDFVFLVGGRSTEHDASIHSFEAFYESLKTTKPYNDRYKGTFYISRTGDIFYHETLPMYHEEELLSGTPHTWSETIEHLIQLDAYCFSLLHGNEGEDGAFQGLAEIVGLKGSFGSVFSAAITMNKWASSFTVNALTNNELTRPKSMLAGASTTNKQIEDWITTMNISKVVVKPNAMGASLLTEIIDANKSDEILQLCSQILEYDRFALIQEFIEGQEYTCGCIHRKGEFELLPIIMANGQSGFLSHSNKHQKGQIDISYLSSNSPIGQKLGPLCKLLFSFFGLSNMARFDFIYSNETWYFLECNSIPGFGIGSSFPGMMQRYDVSLLQLLDLCIDNLSYTPSLNKTLPYQIH